MAYGTLVPLPEIEYRLNSQPLWWVEAQILNNWIVREALMYDF